MCFEVTLDLIVTTKTELVRKTGVLPLGISDSHFDPCHSETHKQNTSAKIYKDQKL